MMTYELAKQLAPIRGSNARDRWLWNSALEAAAKVVEEMERKTFDCVGDPRIRKFTPYKANAILELRQQR